MIKIILGCVIIANAFMLWACARVGGKYER
jgi:hypothetical protein